MGVLYEGERGVVAGLILAVGEESAFEKDFGLPEEVIGKTDGRYVDRGSEGRSGEEEGAEVGT